MKGSDLRLVPKRITVAEPRRLTKVEVLSTAPWKYLYRRAARARMLTLANSRNYRNFGVGAALLGRYSQEGPGRVFSAMNTKLGKGIPKCCAEPVAIGAAWGDGCEEVMALCIVGVAQQHQSGLETDTLHPCDLCLGFMKGHPLTRPTMPILTATPPGVEFVAELHALEQLLAHHGY